MFEKIKNFVLKLLVVVGLITAVAAPALAVDKTMSDVFTAADISTLNSNVYTLVAAVLGIFLLFVAARYIKKALGR